MSQSNTSRLAVAAIALAALLLIGADIGLRISSPSDNAHLRIANPWKEDGVVISPVREKAGGLQEGDVVVAVKGKSMESWVQGLFNLSPERPGWEVGQTVEYRVKRGGELINVPVTLDRYPLAEVVSSVWGTAITVFSI